MPDSFVTSWGFFERKLRKLCLPELHLFYPAGPPGTKRARGAVYEYLLEIAMGN